MHFNIKYKFLSFEIFKNNELETPLMFRALGLGGKRDALYVSDVSRCYYGCVFSIVPLLSLRLLLRYDRTKPIFIHYELVSTFGSIFQSIFEGIIFASQLHGTAGFVLLRFINYTWLLWK